MKRIAILVFVLLVLAACVDGATQLRIEQQRTERAQAETRTAQAWADKTKFEEEGATQRMQTFVLGLTGLVAMDNGQAFGTAIGTLIGRSCWLVLLLIPLAVAVWWLHGRGNCEMPR